jgi:hypothetical protein
MELKTSVSYPWIASKAVDDPTWPAIIPWRIGTRSRAGSVPRAVAIVAACLIEAIMILGFVGASLGLGYESYSGMGPDRPPPPVTPAPAPPPEPQHAWR